jgi:hypothetical protein
MCAHRIDQLINECVSMCDLEDKEFDAIEDNNDHCHLWSDSEWVRLCLPPIQHTAHTEGLVPHCNARGATATDLLTHLSGTLDPAAQCSCDEDHANRSFATVQLLTQSQQL